MHASLAPSFEIPKRFSVRKPAVRHAASKLLPYILGRKQPLRVRPKVWDGAWAECIKWTYRRRMEPWPKQRR